MNLLVPRMKKALLASLLLISNALAQLPQNWSPNFAAPEVNGELLAVAESADAYYIGGVFTRIGSVSVNAIARIDKATGAASAMGTGMMNGTSSGSVAALAVVGTDVYATGTFTTAGGVTASRIAKWDGAAWSALGSGVNASVRNLAVQGTDLIVVGSFTSAGGVTGTNRIARWNGSAWSAIGSTGANSTVDGLLVDGTDIYVSGDFGTIGGISAVHAAKWDGTSWSALGTGLNGGGTTIAKLGSDIYFGGSFTTAGGVASPCVAKWDGSAWSAAGLPLTGLNGFVLCLASAGGDLYAGGRYTTAANGSPAGNRISRWNGTSWSAVGDNDVNDYVNHLITSGSSVIAVGRFDTPHSHIALFDGTAWQPMLDGLGKGLNGEGYSIVELNGKTYVSGDFTHAGTLEVNHVACYDKPTNTWTALPGGHAFSTLLVHNGELYAYYFTDTPAPPYPLSVAKWTGTAWVTVGNLEASLSGRMESIGGVLYAFGDISTANGTPINYIAKWNGTTWSDAGNGLVLNSDSYMQAMCTVNGQLYASAFINANDADNQTSTVFQWNSSAWTTHSTDIKPLINCMTAMGTDLVVGGTISSINGVPCDNNVARWNGSTWSALGTGVAVDGGVNVLLYTHGLLFAGSQNTFEPLQEWNGSTWEEVGGGPNRDVWGIAVQGDELFITGGFTEAGSSISDGEGTIYPAPSSSYIGSYPLTPEIAIEQPANTILVDGSTSIDFGSLATGASTSLTFTLRSTGTIPLLNLSMTKDGTNSSDFTFTAILAVLEDNTSTTFTVTFTPSAAGARSAAIHIASNDANESPFDIALTGTATAGLSVIESWRQTWFGTTTNTGDAADAADSDHDGFTNAMEFALGMNPTLATTPSFQTQVTGGNIEFTYTRSNAALLAGKTFHVPWTETLNNLDWSETGTTQTILTDNGTTQTVKATIPAGTSGRRFVRLEVQ